MKNRGFSLVELIVVIAIIGILAAIAAPAYRGYQTQSKVAEITKITSFLQQKSIVYSQQHGAFATAYDLGLSTTPGKEDVDNPSALISAGIMDNPSAVISMGDADSMSTPCGRVGNVLVMADAYGLGLPGVSAPGDGIVLFAINIIHVNNTIVPIKYSYIVVGSDVYSGNFSGWDNYVLGPGPVFNQDLIDEMAAQDAASTCQ